MARAPFAYWRPIPSATDPKIVPIGVILHVDTLDIDDASLCAL